MAYYRVVTYARDERLALCVLLDESGPQAPTLCEGWLTADLAAHLVLRERRPDAALGILGGPLAGYTDRVRRGMTARTPYPLLVEAISDKWDWYIPPETGGKVVWALVARP